MKSNKEKVTYEHEESDIIVDENGVVKQEYHRTMKTIRYETEPPYVKLYLDCICKFKNIQVSLNPILIEFLKKSSYADCHSKHGGQIIYCTKYMKKEIAEKCNVSIYRVDHALTEFVKKNIFSRIAVGTYQVNPYLFGKGEWKDIKNIRAMFDFGAKDIVAEIIKEEEEEVEVEEEVEDAAE